MRPLEPWLPPKWSLVVSGWPQNEYAIYEIQLIRASSGMGELTKKFIYIYIYIYHTEAGRQAEFVCELLGSLVLVAFLDARLR